MTDLVSKLAGWTFLNEPIYRWVIFIIAITFLMAGWNGILNFMK